MRNKEKPWTEGLCDFVGKRLRHEVGPDHSPIHANDPIIRVAAAFGDHLTEMNEVATTPEIIARTGIEDPEALRLGAWIWNRWVESILPLDAKDGHQ